MGTKSDPSIGSDSPTVQVPGAAAQVENEHPALWQALQTLGERVSEAGPLDGRCRRLIHLALAIGAGSEGATHSHVRRALAEGIDPKELEHAALLGVTTLGWPQAIRGLTWVLDITRHTSKSPA